MWRFHSLSPHLLRRRSEYPCARRSESAAAHRHCRRPLCGWHSAVKSRVRHDPAAPNRSDKIVLANNAVAVLDEIQQQVEHLRLKRNELRAPPKLPAIRIEYLVFKAKFNVRARGRFHGMLKFIGKTIQVGVADCRAAR